MSYGSIEGVMQDSDGVIRAEVVREVDRYLDSGGNEGVGDYEGGIPMVQFEVRILDLYQSEPPITTTLSYLDADAAEVADSGVQPLRVGDDIILMYDVLGPEERPGRTGSVLVPTGGRNGVLDVSSNGIVTPRAEWITTLLEAPGPQAADTDGPISFQIEEISDLAIEHNTVGDPTTSG